MWEMGGNFSIFSQYCRNLGEKSQAYAGSGYPLRIPICPNLRGLVEIYELNKESFASTHLALVTS